MSKYNSSKESWKNTRGDDNESNNLQFIADKYGVSVEDIKLIIGRVDNNLKSDFRSHRTK